MQTKHKKFLITWNINNQQKQMNKIKRKHDLKDKNKVISNQSPVTKHNIYIRSKKQKQTKQYQRFITKLHNNQIINKNKWKIKIIITKYKQAAYRNNPNQKWKIHDEQNIKIFVNKI